jgi:hypothetical protein
MIDLKPFCDKGSFRGLEAPFTVGDWTYATDGHICIRVPRRADAPERGRQPDASKRRSYSR